MQKGDSLMHYVLSDIHGNAVRFDSILAQIQLKPNDTLYILGDVIDRFPDGIAVLEHIMHMNNAKMLLGNHEYMMLNAFAEDSSLSVEHTITTALALWYQNGGDVTHSALKNLPLDRRTAIFRYLVNLPLNLDIPIGDAKFKLVHASPVENILCHKPNADPAAIKRYAVWIRFKESDPIPTGYTLIFGHTPTAFIPDAEPWRIWKGSRAIGIDCGCGYDVGCLGCLRLEDMQEFYSR